MSSDPWGRVDETGTVYVRTADGEQVVGSWRRRLPRGGAGLLRAQVRGPGCRDRPPREAGEDHRPGRRSDAQAAIEHICASRSTRTTRSVTWTALRTRLDQLVATGGRPPRGAHARSGPSSPTRPRHAKEALVAEAEELAQSEQWRAAGERLRALVDTWKGLPRLDRKSDDELWHRFSHARSAFSKRRKAHFARSTRSARRRRKTKERLVAEAEALSELHGLGPDGGRYRELMAEWKAAGRAQREHEDDLWNRFRGAQDVFFAARSAVFAERDAEQPENLKLKEELAEEAEKLLPVHGPQGGPGRLPRASTSAGRPSATCRATPGRRSRAGCTRCERALQEAEEAEWRRTNPEARARAEGLTGQLQAAVDKLRGQDRAGARARATTPRPTSSPRELEGRQALLDQALKGLAGVRRLTRSRDQQHERGPVHRVRGPFSCVPLLTAACGGLRADVTR